MPEAAAAYHQTFRVHSIETDAGGRLAPAALCAFLQESAGRHAQDLGAGMGLLLEQGLAWMLQRLFVEVETWPVEQDEIVVATWPTRFGGAAAERSFLVTDAGGGPVGRAASRWALVDLRARRAVRLPDFIRRLPVAESVAVKAGAVPDVPRDSPVLGEEHLQVGRADLDVVDHANNTRYVEWALEAVPGDWSGEHELAAFDVDFRREARLADALTSRAFFLGDGRLGHALTLAASAEVLATLETRWRPAKRDG